MKEDTVKNWLLTILSCIALLTGGVSFISMLIWTVTDYKVMNMLAGISMVAFLLTAILIKAFAICFECLKASRKTSKKQVMDEQPDSSTSEVLIGCVASHTKSIFIYAWWVCGICYAYSRKDLFLIFLLTFICFAIIAEIVSRVVMCKKSSDG